MSDRFARTNGTLHICIEAGFIPSGPVAELLAAFSVNFPGITFSLKQKSKHKIREHLISGQTNLVFCRRELAEDAARQYHWLTSSLHLLCSDRAFKEINSLGDIATRAKVDVAKDAPTLSHIFKGISNPLQEITLDRICPDRNLTEALIRNGMIGALPLATAESLPVRLRALDQIVPPKKIEVVLSVRKKETRDLIEAIFIEHFLETVEGLNTAV